MKHKVSELECALLDAAVAKIAGLQWQTFDGKCLVHVDHHQTFRDWCVGDSVVRVPAGFSKVLQSFNPSGDWSLGGPIIERERVAIWNADGDWCASMPGNAAYPGDLDYIDVTRMDGYSGRTPLIAAMRAYVASKFGEEVEL